MATTTEASPLTAIPNIKSSSSPGRKSGSKPRARRRASGLGGELWGDTGAPAFATLDHWRDGETKVSGKQITRDYTNNNSHGIQKSARNEPQNIETNNHGSKSIKRSPFKIPGSHHSSSSS
jgi:acyl-CoA-dependent ceramide synthase